MGLDVCSGERGVAVELSVCEGQVQVGRERVDEGTSWG